MSYMDEVRQGILGLAQQYGYDPVDLATVISYETGGTFNPNQPGPHTQWGQHRGLIQWGQPQAQKYLGGDFSVPTQMAGIPKYLADAGYQPGMPLLDMYSAVNAGKVGRYNASDANNGGAPGTVADKVNYQMGPHRAKAQQFLGMTGTDAADLGVMPTFGGARNVGPYGSREIAGDPQAQPGPYGSEPYNPDPAIVQALSDEDKKKGGLGAFLQGLGGLGDGPGTPRPPSLQSMPNAASYGDGGLMQLILSNPTIGQLLAKYRIQGA